MAGIYGNQNDTFSRLVSWGRHRMGMGSPSAFVEIDGWFFIKGSDKPESHGEPKDCFGSAAAIRRVLFLQFLYRCRSSVFETLFGWVRRSGDLWNCDG